MTVKEMGAARRTLGGQCVESLRQSRERRDRLLRLRGLARQSTPPRPARLRNRSRRSNGRGQGEAFGL
jgi:hypothetical protein